MKKINIDGITRDMTPEEVEHTRQLEEILCDVPTQEDRIEAQVMYTALMTDTLLEMEE